jgi:hypothetical protein
MKIYGVLLAGWVLIAVVLLTPLKPKIFGTGAMPIGVGTSPVPLPPPGSDT